MESLFCAEQSRQSGVDIIGYAPEHRIYVAIECPPPWASDDMESKGIPDNLRATVLLDDTKTVYLKGSCNSEKASLVEQYRVEALIDSPGVLA